jgi:hypothetical protein
VVDSEEELAELFLSEARYEQALQEVSSQSGGTLPLFFILFLLLFIFISLIIIISLIICESTDGRQHTTIEAIAQWMVKDVRKEAQAEFESASRPLRW